MKCPKCHAAWIIGSLNCNSCGYKLSDEELEALRLFSQNIHNLNQKMGSPVRDDSFMGMLNSLNFINLINKDVKEYGELLIQTMDWIKAEPKIWGHKKWEMQFALLLLKLSHSCRNMDPFRLADIAPDGYGDLIFYLIKIFSTTKLFIQSINSYIYERDLFGFNESKRYVLEISEWLGLATNELDHALLQIAQNHLSSKNS